ncbi:hypothetical protein [Ferrimonas pelagia]|uniref:Uncharacterized protein n=1 Tax=Ferrimonas pelagia TaxID=1177826 RepID=A0ABP9E8I5_9GAMM
MTIVRVLFIDDDDISQSIDSVKMKLHRSGITLDFEKLDPREHDLMAEFEHGHDIDFSKLKKHINNNLNRRPFDVVACDFSFKSKNVNGYLLLKWLVNTSATGRNAFKRSKFICYSSEEDKFMEFVVTSKAEFIDLVKLNLHAFYKRESLTNELSAMIVKEKQKISMDDTFLKLLENNAEYKFSEGYPRFKGKMLGEIANQITNETHHGRAFKNHFVELTFAHLVDLNS